MIKYFKSKPCIFDNGQNCHMSQNITILQFLDHLKSALFLFKSNVPTSDCISPFATSVFVLLTCEPMGYSTSRVFTPPHLTCDPTFQIAQYTALDCYTSQAIATSSIRGFQRTLLPGLVTRTIVAVSTPIDVTSLRQRV